MLKRLSGILLLGSFFLHGCLEFRDVAPKQLAPSVPDSIGYGRLRLNEFMTGGTPTSVANLLGANNDWIELYNPSDSVIQLGSGQWFVTDDLSVPDKYNIPVDSRFRIPGKGYFAVVCSGISASTIRPTTSFSLSSAGEDLGIFYRKAPGSPLIAIDTLTYTPPIGAQAGVSYGRFPDGAGGIIQLSQITAESTNR